jgi:hypothetical protein
MKKNLKITTILFVFYLLLIYINYSLSSYVFNNEKFYFLGTSPLKNEKIIQVSAIPEHAKAILKVENNNFIVMIPEGSEYFRDIIDDINLFNYQYSKIENRVVNSYFVFSNEFNTSKIFEISKKIFYILTIIFIIFLGIINNVFSPNNYFLFTFNYNKQFFQSIILFSLFSIFSILIYESNFFNFSDYNVAFFSGVSSVFLMNLFSKKLIKILISFIPIFIIAFDLFHNYIYHFFIFSVILNIILSTIFIKTYLVFKTKKNIPQEDQKYDREESNNREH